jgi:hypothetical protein
MGQQPDLLALIVDHAMLYPSCVICVLIGGYFRLAKGSGSRTKPEAATDALSRRLPLLEARWLQ